MPLFFAYLVPGSGTNLYQETLYRSESCKRRLRRTAPCGPPGIDNLIINTSYVVLHDSVQTVNSKVADALPRGGNKIINQSINKLALHFLKFIFIELFYNFNG